MRSASFYIAVFAGFFALIGVGGTLTSSSLSSAKTAAEVAGRIGDGEGVLGLLAVIIVALTTGALVIGALEAIIVVLAGALVIIVAPRDAAPPLATRPPRGAPKAGGPPMPAGGPPIPGAAIGAAITGTGAGTGAGSGKPRAIIIFLTYWYAGELRICSIVIF